MKDKIFFLGPPKSGSKTYAYAMKELGFKALHNHRLISAAMNSLDWDFFRDSEFEFFSDGLLINWPSLMKTFPDSKYIVSYRSPYDIAYSRFNHALEAKRNSIPFPESWGDFQKMVQISEKFYSAIFNLCLSSETKILVTSPTDGWEPLCEFLERDIPNKPFPHCHKKENLSKIMQQNLEPCPSQIPNSESVI